jgi:hypothetical protein
LSCFEVLSELWQAADVESWLWQIRFNKVRVSGVVFDQKLDLEVENLLVLFFGLCRQTLVLCKESVRGLIDLGLLNAPRLAQVVQDRVFLVQ